MPFQIDGRGDAFVLTSPLAGVMLLTRRQPFYPSAAHDKFFSICTAFGGYTEFGIVPQNLLNTAYFFVAQSCLTDVRIVIFSNYFLMSTCPIMAGASCDDVFVIVLFSTFVGMAQGGTAQAADLLQIPVSIVLGVALGAGAGYALSWFFESAYARKRCVRNSMKVVIVLGVALLLMAVETWAEGIVSISGLLAVVSMACVLQLRSIPFVSKRLSEKFGKLWIAAEVLLFVLVGAAVDIRYAVGPQLLPALGMLLLALIFRSIGVCLCLIGTQLNQKERLFCVLAYSPKATVQAAIGSVPLALGLPCGKLVLMVAVLAILITAPLGAASMDLSYRKLLSKEGGPPF